MNSTEVNSPLLYTVMPVQCMVICNREYDYTCVIHMSLYLWGLSLQCECCWEYSTPPLFAGLHIVVVINQRTFTVATLVHDIVVPFPVGGHACVLLCKRPQVPNLLTQ